MSAPTAAPSATTSKSVAFNSLCQTQEGDVRIIGEDDGNVEAEGGSSYPRRISLPDSEADTSREKQVLFSGLYPVVLAGLKQTSRPRIWCLRMIENPWFERLSMMVIIMNCVTLGLYEPCEHKNSNHCNTQKCFALEICDHFVFAFFAVEMMIKMIAMGVWGKLGYLGDKWNRLDAAIVIFGIVEYAVPSEGSINFTAIRTIRVLRPLRAINRVASMRILVMLLLDTLPMLGNVLLLCSFVFFIFGIVAVQLWAGLLRQRCFLDQELFNISGDNVEMIGTNVSVPVPPYYVGNDEVEAICSRDRDAGMFKCSDRTLIPRYKVGNLTCSLNSSVYDPNVTQQIVEGNESCVDWNQYYRECRVDGGNPFQGAINFDNIMFAWVAIFQVISLEGWVDIMYFVMDAHSFYSFIYFILLIVVGSFFMINLCLVVIATQFSETKQREQRLIEEQRLRFKSNDSTLASYSPPGNTYEEILKYISHLYRKNKRKMIRRWQVWKQNREKTKRETTTSRRTPPRGRSGRGTKRGQSIHLHHHHHHHHHHYHISNPPGSSDIMLDSGKQVLNVGVDVHRPRSPSISPTRLMITDGRADSIDVTNSKSRLRLPFPPLSAGSSVHSISGSVTSERNVPPVPERRRSGEVVVEATGAFFYKPETENQKDSRNDYLSGKSSPHQFGGYVTSKLNCSCPSYGVTNPECFESGAEEEVDDGSNSTRPKKKCIIHCYQLMKKKVGAAMSETSNLLKRLVDSSYYQHFIMGAILINTLSMGIEHHEQPATLTKVLEISNVIFTTIFALEMLTKLLAYGLLGYIANLYNVFDAVIVVVSVLEIAADSKDAGNGGLSVLRTFRLLRILKLVRFLPALRRQLVVLMKTMDNVATFMMLLTLFIFIFSILGMHLFGCKFCWVNKYGETECDRKNFDTLLWACVTVFQILTQEDWNVVLYNGMDAIGPFAAIYFITLMTIGNYVLFNLLVAILVEGFQAECYSDCDQKVRNGSHKSECEEAASILAKKYTEKIARSLGLQVKPKKSAATFHDVGDEEDTEELPSEESISPEDVGCVHDKPIITLTLDTGSCKASMSAGAVYHSVPIITHTSATPTNSPTPGGSPSIERLCMDEAPVENSSTHETYSITSGSSERRASIRSSKLAPNLQLSITTLHRQRSISSESRRSSVSSTSSRSGSWSLRRSKPVPLDEQSLVSWEDDQCEQEDLNFSRNEIITYDDVSVNFDDATATASHQSSATSFRESLCVKNLADDVDIQNGESDKMLSELSVSCCMCHLSLPYWTYQRRDWSLYLLPPRSLFRRSVAGLVAKKWFDNIILLFIFANCVTIAMESPTLERDSTMRQVLDILNCIFTVVFTIEMCLKVVASGFFVGLHAYLKSGWNVLDFFLVVTSLVDMIMTWASENGSSVLGILRVFRLLRALRPLRVISRAPGLKLVVQTLISSLKPIGNIVLICCAFFIIFGILGVQLLKGEFYYCIGDDVRYIEDRASCEAAGYKWDNRRYNFDHLGQALMSLFVLSSKDGWVEIMYNGIDAVGVDKQPKPNNKPEMLLFFISFLLIVGFFVINMFVGVVVENFHRCREEHEQQELRRKMEARERKEEKLRLKRELRQMRGYAARKTFRRRTLSRVRYRVDGIRGRARRLRKRVVRFWKAKTSQENYLENYGSFRLRVYRFCTSKYFELAISAVIGINIITMAVEHYNQPQALEVALKYANYVFTGVFVLEAALKLYALGGFGYFRNLWNHMDMAIVILSVVGIVIEDAASASENKLPINPTIVRFMRVLRIARVLKLLKVSKGIRSLLETVFRALPQVGNLGLLFLLLFFIFAALGVELFGTLKCDEDQHPCDGLNRLANFENFGIALLTLFRISTGDNWNGIMKDTLRTNCDSSASCTVNCCVNAIISPLYFVTFVMMAQFVLVNVVIAVLMKQLEDSRADSSVDEDDDNDVFDSDDDDVDDKEKEDDFDDDRENMNQDVSFAEQAPDDLVVISNDSSSVPVNNAEIEVALLHVNSENGAALCHEGSDAEGQELASESSSTSGDLPSTPSSSSGQCSSRSSPHASQLFNLVLPPPSSLPLLSSNSLRVTGCRSTGASPSRSIRHGSLPARTKSLNLPGSECEGMSPTHLPLHPCHSDPSARSYRPSNNSTTPLSKRRIERHLSDNPMLLRPDSSPRVHHHHHYLLPSQALSKSTSNVSASNPISASLESNVSSGSSASLSLSTLSSPRGSSVMEEEDDLLLDGDCDSDQMRILTSSAQEEEARDESHQNEINLEDEETNEKIPPLEEGPITNGRKGSGSSKAGWIEFVG